VTFAVVTDGYVSLYTVSQKSCHLSALCNFVKS